MAPWIDAPRAAHNFRKGVYNPDAYRPGGGSPEEPLAVREKTLVGWLKRLLYSSLRPRGAEVLRLFFDGYAPESVRLRLIA